MVATPLKTNTKKVSLKFYLNEIKKIIKENNIKGISYWKSYKYGWSSGKSAHNQLSDFSKIYQKILQFLSLYGMSVFLVKEPLKSLKN